MSKYLDKVNRALSLMVLAEREPSDKKKYIFWSAAHELLDNYKMSRMFKEKFLSIEPTKKEIEEYEAELKKTIAEARQEDEVLYRSKKALLPERLKKPDVSVKQDPLQHRSKDPVAEIAAKQAKQEDESIAYLRQEMSRAKDLLLADDMDGFEDMKDEHVQNIEGAKMMLHDIPTRDIAKREGFGKQIAMSETILKDMDKMEKDLSSNKGRY